MKAIDIYGLGSPVVDCSVRASDDYLAQHGFTPGSSEIVAVEEQAKLHADFSTTEEHFSGGGSVLNSIDGHRKLGGNVFFNGRAGNDRFGTFLIEELRRDGVQFASSLQVQGPNALSFVMITPDGERTMRTALGVASDLCPDDITPTIPSLQTSEWLFIEGYAFANGERSVEAVGYALDEANKNDVKVALTVGDAGVARAFRPLFEEAMDGAALIIANHKEALAVSDRSTLESAIDTLKDSGANLAISDGPGGVYTVFDGVERHVPAFKIDRVISSTGAGDSMAGGLLFGLTHGLTPERSALAGCYIASKVIQQEAARLPEAEMKRLWAEVTSADRSTLRQLGWKVPA